MRIASICGVTIDWDDETQTGDYNAWFDSMPMPPSTTVVLPGREGSYPLGVGARIDATVLPPIHLLIMDDANPMYDRAWVLRNLDTAHEFKSLVVVPDEDDPDNYYYWTVGIQSIDEQQDALGVGRHLVITAVIVGDPLLTSVDSDTDFQSILNTEEVSTVTQFAVLGDADTFPTITVNAPTVADGWTSRRFINIRWMSPNAATRYPIELTSTGWNTTSISSHGVGVIVDGVHNEYWFGADDTDPGGWNSTTTKIWTNLDFAPAVSAVVGSYDSTNGILTLREGYSVEDFPAQGILQCTLTGTRLMTYTGRDFYNNTLTGVTLAAFGSSSHTPVANDTIYWIQHEVWIVNGDAIASPYWDPQTTHKPLFLFSQSNNLVWHWDTDLNEDTSFGSLVEKNRPGAWRPTLRGEGTRIFWIANDATADPFPDFYMVMGMHWPGPYSEDPNNYVRWQSYFPCSISEINMVGEADAATPLTCYVSPDGHNWEELFTADMVAGSPWDDFDDTGEPILPGRHYVKVEVFKAALGVSAQVNTVTITFDTDSGPVATMLGAQNNLALEMSINSSYFDETLYINLLPGLREDVESLVIDCQNFTAVIMPGGRNAYQAIRRDAPRGWLFRLHPGDNDDLTFTTTYPTDSSVTMVWYDRRYM